MSVFALTITSIAVGGAVKACGCCGHADTNDLSFPIALTQQMPGSFRDCINLPAGSFVTVSNSKHGGNVAEHHSTTTHAVIEEMKKLATLEPHIKHYFFNSKKQQRKISHTLIDTYTFESSNHAKPNLDKTHVIRTRTEERKFVHVVIALIRTTNLKWPYVTTKAETPKADNLQADNDKVGDA